MSGGLVLYEIVIKVKVLPYHVIDYTVSPTLYQCRGRDPLRVDTPEISRKSRSVSRKLLTSLGGTTPDIHRFPNYLRRPQENERKRSVFREDRDSIPNPTTTGS